MKRVIIRKTLLLMVASFTLVGCGGGGGIVEEQWGIDFSTIDVEVSYGPLDPATGYNRCNIEDATLVYPGENVEPLTSDTKLRIWHFGNSEEYACVLKGQAVIRGRSAAVGS